MQNHISHKLRGDVGCDERVKRMCGAGTRDRSIKHLCDGWDTQQALSVRTLGELSRVGAKGVGGYHFAARGDVGRVH